MYSYAHVDAAVGGFGHVFDGLDHGQAHVHTEHWVIRPRLGGATDAVITVAQDLDPQLVVFLNKKGEADIILTFPREYCITG